MSCCIRMMVGGGVMMVGDGVMMVGGGLLMGLG